MDNEFEEIEDIIPRHENIICFCQLKMFVCLQLLKKNNEITDLSFYDNSEIYLNFTKAIKNIEIHSFSMDKKSQNNYKLILTHQNKYYFVFKLLIGTQMKKDEKELNDYVYNDNLTGSTFIYPETMMFFEKIKESTFNKFASEKFHITPKALFYDIKKIVLIDETRYKKLLTLTYSDYTQHTLNKNTIPYTDITFSIFFHPTLNNINTIYGFEFYTTNLVNLVDIDIRLKVPKLL